MSFAVFMQHLLDCMCLVVLKVPLKIKKIVDYLPHKYTYCMGGGATTLNITK